MSKARSLADLGNVYDDGALSHRRLTYNGAMNVWQRGTTADTATSGDYMCDRWQLGFTGLDGNVDWDQETSSTPDGFAYALKISTDASETSLDAADYLFLHQKFEGQDLQHLQKGTSGAKKLALSFWVKSSVASTYTVGFRDTDNSRIISKSYTINTADTWEYKTVIFEGDTTGSLTNDNNTSLDLQFWIDTGSNWTSGTFSTDWIAQDNTKRVYDTTGWLESTSPTFYITGVQLEVGDTATPFEHRSYGDELARCQRYYQTFGTSSSNAYGTGTVYRGSTYLAYTLPVTPRATPTISSAGGWQTSTDGGSYTDRTPYLAGFSGNQLLITAWAGGGYDQDTITYGRLNIDSEL
jgi:hypothetical protein